VTIVHNTFTMNSRTKAERLLHRTTTTHTGFRAMASYRAQLLDVRLHAYEMKLIDERTLVPPPFFQFKRPAPGTTVI